jgi:predicted phosphodiesterase
MPRDKTVLLQFSDIHLREEELGSGQDLDQDIREKLVQDLEGGDLPIQDGVDGVLITGDVAYAGRRAEFESAYAWLQELCRRINCQNDRVWVVPGNHDVHRPTIEGSRSIQLVHESIRGDANQAAMLRTNLLDGEVAHALLQPFGEYNRFAAQFRSETLPDAISWESDDDELVLNDGSILRLRGINSALVSDRHDEDGPPAQVLGTKQVELRNGPGVVCVALCHHPPDWLHDQDTVADYLTSRASIQLYGHKHRQRVRREEESIRLSAGALHPNRGEDNWQPRYNLLVLQVVGTGDDRRLRTEIHQRAWRSEQTRFGPDVGADGAYPKVYELKLEPWKPSRASEPSPDAEAGPATMAPATESEMNANPSPREVVYKLFSIAYPTRMKLMLSLGLVRDGDEDLSDSELIQRVVRRARENGQLRELRGC